jgi:hypothetical protein
MCVTVPQLPPDAVKEMVLLFDVVPPGLEAAENVAD